MADQVFTGTSTAVDPAEALGQALGAALAQLMAAGGNAFDVRRMDWIADRPAAFHPARRAIDFAWREAMAGIRPPVTVRHGPGRLTVHLQAELPARPADDTPIWREYTRAQLAQQDSPRSQVPSMQGVFDAWRREGDAWRARHPEALDIAYGPGQRWDVSMQRVATATGDVIVCAIGGSAAERRQRIGRTAAAAQRILAA